MKSTTYRIYTEMKPMTDVAVRHAMKAQEIPSYTIFAATGCWNEASEASCIVEVIHTHDGVLTPGEMAENIEIAAKTIKKLLSQEAVLVSSYESTSFLV